MYVLTENIDIISIPAFTRGSWAIFGHVVLASQKGLIRWSLIIVFGRQRHTLIRVRRM